LAPEKTVKNVLWSPQVGPQTALIECPVFEVFYGGARGGGKTEGSIGDWLQHAGKYGADAIGVFFRRTAKQLEEVVARTKSLFPLIGASYREQKSEWTMANGARLKFRYLERDSDAEQYQGHSYTRVYIEEVPNFPSPEPINKLRATLRSPAGVPVGMRLTGNPGGVGHTWVKKRYIDPEPKGYKIIKEIFQSPFDASEILLERVFIPSKLSDNPLLMQNDPSYVARLQQQGSARLVDAWLRGDWEIILGAFFDCFDETRHVLGQEWLSKIPRDATRFRSFDWGSSRPFSVGWYVVSDGSWGLPKKALLKYREWYGSTGAPNVGLKMTAEMVAEGILRREEREKINYGVADPQIFIRDGGPSIGERMLVRKCIFRAADRRRKVGWDQLRQYLLGEDGIPHLYFLESCEDSIRTIPALQHDEHDEEDLDTEAEDHAADETRYAVMSRPYLPRTGEKAPPLYPRLPSEMTINELVKKRSRDRLEAEEARI
jgi:hypothetical protein